MSAHFEQEIYLDRLDLPPLSGKRGPSSSKKIILYAIIGVVAVAAIAVTVMRGSGPSPEDLEEQSRKEAIANFKKQLCGDGTVNSSPHIKEYLLPSECEIPLGIAVDEERVWYVSTKHGTLGSYRLADGDFEEYLVPSWPARSEPTDLSMAWAVRIDPSGNVWLTDNENLLWKFERTFGTFEMFKSPANEPISFDFDSDGNIYLVGVRSSSLFFGDVSEMKEGTDEGFTEIKLPLDAFRGIDSDRVNSGSVTVDRERNAVWMSLLSYPVRGQIFRYDIDANEITAYDLPQELNSPVGTTVDDDGNLWVTDHGTSVFFMLDPDDGSMERYVTSISSARIYGGTTPPNAYTLPYWIQKGEDGSVWFNQHQGNRISRFDPGERTLVEYWIPTQNEKWANCPEGAATCGIANALQFAVGPDGKVWFTEWSENKIGTVSEKEVPFSISAPDEVTVARGDSAEIKVGISSGGDFAGRMIASGTFTYTGGLGSSTGIFSQQSVSLDGGTRQVSFVFSPANDLVPGEYVLMLGADDGDVAVLRAVTVNVV